MQGVYFFSATGQIGERRGAEIRFPARGGLTTLRVGTGFTALTVVTPGALQAFLSRAKEVLEQAGHPTRLVCVLPKPKHN